MAKSREIKKRMKAVRNIQRITKTMQMIATSKFAKAQQAAVASKPYTRGLFDLVAQLAATLESSGSGESHPLLAEPPAGKPEITLIITSDRGLAGPYNGNVIRTAMRHLREHAPAREGRVELVGKKGLAVLEYNRIPIARRHTQFGDKPKYPDVDALAREYIAAFAAGEVSAVRVVSMRYISAGKQTPQVLQLLPFSREEAEARRAATTAADAAAAASTAAATANTRKYADGSYDFSPSAGALLGDLLPAAVKAMLFQAFNDAVVSEHVARMVAMKSATDNAGKMRKSLSRRYNRARQAQITTELTEIISGAAALA